MVTKRPGGKDPLTFSADPKNFHQELMEVME
jgi:hypothetical protein